MRRKIYDKAVGFTRKTFALTVRKSFVPLGTHMGGKASQIARIQDKSSEFLRIMESTSKKGKDAPALLRGHCDVEKVFVPLAIAMQIAKMLRASKSAFRGDIRQAYTYSDGNFDPHYSEGDRLSFARFDAQADGFIIPKDVLDANLAGCFALTMQQGLINYNVANIFSNGSELDYLRSALRNAEGVGEGYYDLLSRTRGWIPFNSLSNVFGGVAGAVHIVQDNTASGVKEYKRLVEEKIRAGKPPGKAMDEAFTQIAQAFAMTEACVDNAGIVTLQVAEAVPQFGNCLGSILNNLTFHKEVFGEVFNHRDIVLIDAVEKPGLKISIDGRPVDISFSKGNGKKIFSSGKASVRSELAIANEQLKDAAQSLAIKIEEVMQ
jgi:hypothetical protein